MKTSHLIGRKIKSITLAKPRGLDEQKSYAKKLTIITEGDKKLEVLPVYGNEVLVSLDALDSFENACRAIFSGKCDHLTVAELRERLECVRCEKK